MIPWIERPIIYDVRARPNLVESTSGSRDLQMVSFLIESPFPIHSFCSECTARCACMTRHLLWGPKGLTSDGNS